MKRSRLIRKTPLRSKGLKGSSFSPAEGSVVSQAHSRKPTLTSLVDSGVVRRASSLPKPTEKMRARKPRKDGMTQPKMLKKLLEERGPQCEVCGCGIANPSMTNLFHILGKGAYPSMKFDERNLLIVCHRDHDDWTTKSFNPTSEKWKWVVILYDELKLEANGLKP